MAQDAAAREGCAMAPNGVPSGRGKRTMILTTRNSTNTSSLEVFLALRPRWTLSQTSHQTSRRALVYDIVPAGGG